MAGNQQFCLRWNNHQSTLISVFDNLLESGTLVDCTLAAEGQYLKAHKVVLSACSPFFEGVFSQHYEKHPIIILKDVTFTELKAMLDYMYRGEVNISQEQLGTFLKAAESLQIKGLTDSGNGEIKRERKIPPLFPQGLIVEQRAPKVNNNDSPPPPLSLSPKRRKRKSSEEKEEMILAEQSSPALPPGADGVVKTEMKGGSDSGGEQFEFEDDEEIDLSKPGTSANSHPPGGWNASTESQSDDAFTLPGGSQEQERWVVSRPLVQSLKSGSGRGSVSRNIACPTCHKTYSSQHTLRRHMRLECGKEPQFHCPYCPRKTKQRYNLMLHIARAHKPEHHLQSPWT
nr:longitudinals lacking protein, isoforms A/B/D/L-like isoform X6 [Halyomorpha halys]